MTSRFSVTDTPILSPGHCWISKNSEGPFIDTGVDVGRMFIERGRIYISVEILREMARVAGILDEGKSASAELKEQEWFNKGYSEALKENYGDLLTRLADRVGPSVLDTFGVTGVVEEEDNAGPSGQSLEGTEDAGVTERKVASTGSRKRPPRVSANTGDESSYRL
jgi:hypothetical protein